MANSTIIQKIFTNVTKWAVAIVAATAILTSGAAALGLSGSTAVAENTWPAPLAQDDPDNTWPAPPADDPDNTWPAPLAQDDPDNTWPVPPADDPDNTWPSA
ncbi:hypothetical protein ACTMTI_03340 [Nonomuraea sp. H19]|uniref:hypothetical protein n=1 Tax=Nonomuraea sp. H19 TaxID=3452206 RepID=UPI003F8957A6